MRTEKPMKQYTNLVKEIIKRFKLIVILGNHDHIKKTEGNYCKLLKIFNDEIAIKVPCKFTTFEKNETQRVLCLCCTYR